MRVAGTSRLFHCVLNEANNFGMESNRESSVADGSIPSQPVPQIDWNDAIA